MTPRFCCFLSVLVLSAPVVFPAVALGQIRINEILPNPSGSDTGTERIEIYNAGSTPIDVTGWAIDDAATFDQVAVRARLPEDFDATCSIDPVIQPGEYRLVMGTTTAAWVNNSGDDIYLISDRNSVPPTVVHQVTYGQSMENMGWAAVPDGSVNFAWRVLTLCASNGGTGDGTPPAAVSDLAAAPGDQPGEIHLTWTAPGDDATTGTASEYRIRVSYATMDETSFEAAADLERWTNEPLPSPAGTPEEWTVFGLSPDSSYFFALSAIDEAGNEGGVSNSPGAVPAAGALLDPDLGYNVYFGNLHSHTGYSDGAQTPDDAYFYARFTAPTPLDFLAVTDHNHSAAGMQVSDYAAGLSQAALANQDGEFIAIYGQEWGFASSGHVNIFESPVLYGWEPGNYDVFVAEGDYASLYSAILANPPAEYPPIAQWNHPGTGDFGGYAVTPDGQSVVHLMALVNGPAASTATDESDVGNTNFDGVFADALRAGYRVSPVADQDNHEANWGASTQSRTGVLATEKTKSSILDALAARRTYATMDHNASVAFSADGHAMGEAFVASEGVRISATVGDPDPGAATTMIELFRGITGVSTAARVAFNEDNSEFFWRELESFADGTEVHYYLRIRLASGFRIWTGPVYVTYDQGAVIAARNEPASRISLATPHPNPARGAVTMSFALPPGTRTASLTIHDASGRLIRRMVHHPVTSGPQRATWDGWMDSGARARTGIYFIRLEARGASVTRKLIYLR